MSIILKSYTPDEAIWSYAKENGLTILTCHSDFVALAQRNGSPPKVIRLENMNYRTRVALQTIRSHAVLISEFEKTSKAVLLLRARLPAATS